MKEPLFLFSPSHPASHGTVLDTQVTLLDIVPTVLDWFKIPYPHYSIFKKQGKVKLTGTSLIGYLTMQEKMERVG